LLKAIEFSYKQNENFFPLDLIAQQTEKESLFVLQNLITEHKKHINLKDPKARDFKDQLNKDIYSAFTQIKFNIKGIPTSLRNSLFEFCMNYCKATQKNDIDKKIDAGITTLRYYIKKIDLLVNFKKRLYESTDCSFMYWVKDMLPLTFKEILKGAINLVFIF